MGRGFYPDWIKMLDSMTPDDILTGPVPRNMPHVTASVLEKLRMKFSGISDDERARCKEAIAKYEEDERKKEQKRILMILNDEVKRAEYAREEGIKRAEREAHDKRFSELGIPRFVQPDGPDAAARVIHMASMRGSDRAKLLERLIDGSRCDECFQGDCATCGMALCMSEWKWIQKAAERCIEKGETVYPEPKYPKKESERHGTD